MIQQTTITIQTKGRGFINMTADIQRVLAQQSVPGTAEFGLCHLFIQHTSASLMIGENADPAVMVDLENFMARLAPDGDQHYTHTEEGPDDMSAHIRSILTASSLTVPIQNHRLALGRWQGIFLWEHRFGSHERKVIISIHI